MGLVHTQNVRLNQIGKFSSAFRLCPEEDHTIANGCSSLRRLVELHTCLVRDLPPARDFCGHHGSERRARHVGDVGAVALPGIFDRGCLQGLLQFPGHPFCW